MLFSITVVQNKKYYIHFILNHTHTYNLLQDSKIKKPLNKKSLGKIWEIWRKNLTNSTPLSKKSFLMFVIPVHIRCGKIFVQIFGEFGTFSALTQLRKQDKTCPNGQWVAAEPFFVMGRQPLNKTFGPDRLCRLSE